MKNVVKIILSGAFAVFALSSCRDNKPHEPGPLVVEGWIENGKPPVIMLHRAIDLSTESGSVYDYLEKNMFLFGHIRLSDGDTAVMLTEQLDPSYFIPLRYSTAYIFGETGRTYTIDVECEGQRVHAQTTLPEPVPVDSIVITGGNEDYVNIRVWWTDNPSTEDYYNLYYRTVDKAEYVACSFAVRGDGGAGGDGAGRGKAMSSQVWRSGGFIDTSAHSMLFRRNDTLTVKLAHIDKASYDFWMSFRNQGLSNNEASNTLVSNIEGGRGYWCGMGSTEYVLLIGNDTVIIPEVIIPGR